MKIIEFLKFGFDDQKDLNTLLWKNSQTIKPEIRLQLLKIANHFKKYVGIEFPIKDVIITGGQTGKFYTEHSDIDLHLITDFSKIDCDEEIYELFDTKRKLYQKEYDIKIKGISVELYVENINQPSIGGSYSIVTNKWIKHSTNPTTKINQEKILKVSDKLLSIINYTLSSNDIKKLQTLKSQIWQYRKMGLAKDGEYGTANLVFKTLRNSGILKTLLDKIKDLENKDLSIDQ